MVDDQHSIIFKSSVFTRVLLVYNRVFMVCLIGSLAL